MSKLKYPISYEEWVNLKSTKKAMKIIMKDFFNHKKDNQLRLF